MADRFFFGTNFKMHHTPDETRQFVTHIQQLLGVDPGAQLFIIPPFTSLPGLASLTRSANIWLGAQNMHWARQGAYTGEISPTMLHAVGVELVMLGHAERRQLFGETDQALKKKVAAACEIGFRVLLCVGETAEEKGFGITREVLGRQLRIALNGFAPESLPRLMIAYEPVWSIGEGGTPATVSEVAPAVGHIRTTLGDLFGAPGHAVPILYGGSVNLQNCTEYAAMDSMNGLFVGRSAWQPQGFAQVLQAALKARRR